MIDGIILGIITWLGISLLFVKMPQWFQNLCFRHQAITDFSGSVIAYLMLSSVSKSLIAVSGAAVAGLLIGISLFLYTKFIMKDNNAGRNK